MEQEKSSGWFGSLFAGGSPTPPSGLPKDTAPSIVVQSAPREEAKSNKKGSSLSTAWPMRQKRPAGSAASGSNPPSSAASLLDEGQANSRPYVPSSHATFQYGQTPPSNTQPPPASSQNMSQTPLVAAPVTGSPSLASQQMMGQSMAPSLASGQIMGQSMAVPIMGQSMAAPLASGQLMAQSMSPRPIVNGQPTQPRSGPSGDVVDEIQSVVKKILYEFEQRFNEQVERRLCEVELKVTGLQEQLEKLHRVVGGLGSSNSLALMNYENRSNDGSRAGLDMQNDNLGEVLAKLQKEREEAVQSLQSELHELRQGVATLPASTSPSADTDDQMNRLESELRLVAEIVQLKGNTLAPRGNQPGNGVQGGDLLTLPEGAHATQMQSGIMDQLRTFEQSTMRYWGNRPPNPQAGSKNTRPTTTI